jgi:hypothetical protein
MNFRAFLCLFLAAGLSAAERLRLSPTRDGSMLATGYRNGFHDDNLGHGSVLQLGTAGGSGLGNETRSLIAFDLANLPNRPVIGITLRLFVEGGDIAGHSPFTAEVRTIAKEDDDWLEGTAREQDDPDDGFTWESKDGKRPWLREAGLRSSKRIVASSTHTSMPAINSAVDFEFQGDLQRLVAENTSFVLMHPDPASLGANKRLRFHSREVAEFAPRLIVTLEGDPEPLDFATQVYPIFETHCHRCHGPKKQEGRLRLDARAIVFAGGNSGPAVIPGDSDLSLLMRRLRGHGGEVRMPDGKPPLANSAIQIIARWIDQGASWPDGIGSPLRELPKHWAYTRPKRPTLPAVANAAWCANPIDRFVLATLESRGLQPSPHAQPETWLRRVTLDLIGLPPSLAEIDAFLAEGSKEKVVDRLLASRHFGERWAQPWLDLARYGDSTGIHEDELRPTWAWRDWVIQALNADMPFDRFSIEQLAGDLLPKASESQRIATGFHRAAPYNTESGTPKEARRTAQVLDRVNVTGTVWLGTTFECAQCHDHHYDPFTQRDYYRFYAYFNHTPDESGPNVGAGRNAQAGPSIAIGDTRSFVMQEMAQPRQTRIFERGNYETPGATVTNGLPRFLHRPADDLPANRLGLARWLLDPANPLTARVTVNRWWAELFGHGLVATTDDFGAQGDLPTHPELLDWLALEFVERGWSMKQMLRSMVLSSSYGQSSVVSEANLQEDPECRWLTRAPRLRLSAEAIRDNALSISGLLSSAIGGAPVYPPQPDGLWWIRDDKSPRYETSQGESRYRRGLYTVWRRSYLHPSLAVFDAPDRVNCRVKRLRTNTPLQALTLLNDPIYTEAAFSLARHLAALPGSTAERIRQAFRLTTARFPSVAESATLQELLAKQRARFAKDLPAARQLIDSVRGELESGVSLFENEAAAELAAWYHLATVLLNLDETITRG